VSNKKWNDEEMLPIALRILDIELKDDSADFGYPYLTPYQIALKFKELYPVGYDELGMKIGGKETNEYNSLSQGFSRMLTKNSRNFPNNNVEKAYFYRQYNKNLVFSTEEYDCIPSENQFPYLSMFRLIKNDR